jgi:hypothetical protein
MDNAQFWLQIFRNWPAGYPRQGIVITSIQESIPFSNFMTSEGIVLLDRDKPDAIGARKVMVAMSTIIAIKLTDTFELSRFKAFGFEGGGVK